MKKVIVIILVIVVLAGAMKVLGLDEYLSAYTGDETANVTVTVVESGEKNEISEAKKRLVKYIVTENAQFNTETKPEKFDDGDYLKDIKYSIIIDDQEYIYKPVIDTIAMTKFGKTTYATLESLDNSLLNYVVSD